MSGSFTTRSGAPPLSVDAVAGLVYAVGLRGERAAIAVAITTPESGRDASVRVYNEASGDDSYGLWQINMLDLPGGPHLGPARRRQFGIGADGELVDPATNANAMYVVSGGGGSFYPWSAYKNGLHLPYMADARAAVAAVEARGGNPSSGPSRRLSDVGSGSVVDDLGRSADITWAIPGAIDPHRTSPLSAVWDPGFFIRGQALLRTLLAGQMLGGSIDLSVDDIAELTIEVGALFQSTAAVADELELDVDVDWWDLIFKVAGHDWGEGPSGLHQFTATCRAAGPTAMRKRVGLREKTWARQSPTEVLSQVATEHDMRFVGEGSNRRDEIVRKGPADGAPVLPADADTTESDWDLGQRLGKEEGYWCFETAGTLYFARPSWLVTRMPRLDINQWAGGVGGVDDFDKRDRRGVLGVPRARRTFEDDLTPGMPPRTVNVRLPREIGEQVRPGMVADFVGGIPRFDGAYLVGKVSFPFDGGLEPAEVELVEAVDPVPQPATDPDADPTVDATTDSATPVGTAGASALDMVTVALRQIGDRYVWGAEASPADPDPTEFDCSELVEWACARVGVSFPDYSETQIATVVNAGLERDVGDCANIRGALLHHPGHVAISLGDGAHTVEAMGRQYGVVQGNIGTRFSRGGLIPGLVYPAGS